MNQPQPQHSNPRRARLEKLRDDLRSDPVVCPSCGSAEALANEGTPFEAVVRAWTHPESMHDAIRERVDDADVSLVIRSVTIAEVLLDGHDSSALATVTTGDMPNWATIGMLRATLALAETAHVEDAIDDE